MALEPFVCPAHNLRADFPMGRKRPYQAVNPVGIALVPGGGISPGHVNHYSGVDQMPGHGACRLRYPRGLLRSAFTLVTPSMMSSRLDPMPQEHSWQSTRRTASNFKPITFRSRRHDLYVRQQAIEFALPD
jgi:hypothetical protein